MKVQPPAFGVTVMPVTPSARMAPPKLKVGWTLLKKTAGFRYLMT